MNNELQEVNDYGRIEIKGKKISSSWWGQKWCKNIENYDGLKNRLERGRTYIRNNTILSFIISKNRVDSLVKGTSDSPYNVCIKIAPIDEKRYKNIINKCTNSIENIEVLCSGDFPNEYQELFTNKQYGLFPTQNEITYSCTCLDYLKNNHMCKHIAATLYGIGNKLDSDPSIFFKLRGINIEEFTKYVTKYENNYVWNKINIESEREIDSSKAKNIFGINYEDDDFLDISVENLFKIDEKNGTDNDSTNVKTEELNNANEEYDNELTSYAWEDKQPQILSTEESKENNFKESEKMANDFEDFNNAKGEISLKEIKQIIINSIYNLIEEGYDKNPINAELYFLNNKKQIINQLVDDYDFSETDIIEIKNKYDSILLKMKRLNKKKIELYYYSYQTNIVVGFYLAILIVMLIIIIFIGFNLIF